MGRATISWLNGVLERAKGVWLGFSSAIVTDTRPLRPLSASTDVRNRKGLARQYTARTWERVRTTGFLACQWFAVKARLAAAEHNPDLLQPGKAAFHLSLGGFTCPRQARQLYATIPTGTERFPVKVIQALARLHLWHLWP